ncbi:MAG: hypothetical protein SFT94_05600 [Pseudanabaenaceae cyanobacterium bins.68]|nr:hypothetical protein [Pseudanabaenaceae cyanobacterium bins.68]
MLLAIPGAIVSVGGTLAKAQAINALIALLAKVAIPKSDLKRLIIDKLLDYGINQLTGGGSDVPETYKTVLIFAGQGSVVLPLGVSARALVITITAIPVGYGRRFSQTVQPGQQNNLPNGTPAIQYQLPDKFDLGGVSFAGIIPTTDPTGIAVNVSTGFSQEIPLTWQVQTVTVPKLVGNVPATTALVYLPPFVGASITLVYAEIEGTGSGGGASNGGNNDPPDDGLIFIDFDGDGNNDVGTDSDPGG